MTEHKLDGRHSLLEFYFRYDLTDAEDREVPYTRTGARYKPDYLRFTLTSSCENGALPRYSELQRSNIRLFGKKRKKDGTPGEGEAKEIFYSYEKDLPDWVAAIIEEAAVQVKAEAGELHG